MIILPLSIFTYHLQQKFSTLAKTRYQMLITGGIMMRTIIQQHDTINAINKPKSWIAGIYNFK